MMRTLTALLLMALMLTVCLPTLAENGLPDGGSTIRISFEFRDQQAADLDQLNALLATMPLTDLDLEAPRGYLCQTKHYAEDGETVLDTTYRYGLTSGTLVCELPSQRMNEDGEAHIYQIGQEPYPLDAAMDGNAFYSLWSAEHPDAVIRTLITISFDDHDVFLYFYHACDAR